MLRCVLETLPQVLRNKTLVMSSDPDDVANLCTKLIVTVSRHPRHICQFMHNSCLFMALVLVRTSFIVAACSSCCVTLARAPVALTMTLTLRLLVYVAGER